MTNRYTPEEFIEDWYTPDERVVARRGFERAGLLRASFLVKKELALEATRQRSLWWQRYRELGARADRDRDTKK